jgi:PH (Pleckstrin Homology) domain-containing protein
VAEQLGDPATPELPVVWRVPPWQPAALNVVAAVLLAVLLYASPSAAAVVGLGAGAVIAVTGAVLAMRYLVVADEDGVVVRRALSRHVIPWTQLASVEAVVTHGVTMTVRLTSTDKTIVDVPPTLVQPTLPTNVRKAHAMVHARALQLAELAAGRRV